MTTRKIIWTPTTKEPKINHALAASSAFNLKLCHIVFFFHVSLNQQGLIGGKWPSTNGQIHLNTE